jgi:hypothetical protein
MMSMIAEVNASALATGLTTAGLLSGKPLLSAARRKRQRALSALERFVSDHPDMAERPYGEALAASLAKEFPCSTL